MNLLRFLALLLLGISSSFSTLTPTGEVVLARVDLESYDTPLNLPVHALHEDAGGHPYALVFATELELAQTGRPWRVLGRAMNPVDCLVVVPLPGAERGRMAEVAEVLHDDGLRALVRATSEQAEALGQLRFDVRRLTPEPVEWPLPQEPLPRRRPFGERDPRVARLIGGIEPAGLHSLVARLSGAEPVLVEGKPLLIKTRHTTSGAPLSNALSLVYARLEALGLKPEYHRWSAGGYVNRNVFGTLPGGARSNELVLITAHLDDQPSGPLAPGADDNASGCAGVLTAAGALSQFSFERTIRFVLFTGEEQGLYGSSVYAANARTASNNIVAVLNLDMISWDSGGPSTFELHTRIKSSGGYSNDLAIAAAFTNAAATYGLTEITPVIKADGLDASDHYYFWQRGYAAIAASEDYTSDFIPYYHTTQDTVDRMNLPYFTDAVRAATAAAADLAILTGSNSAVVLEIANSDWSPTSGIGGSRLVARHLPGAEELELEPLDLALTNTLPNPNSRWLKLDTAPYEIELAVDSRPVDSETVFTAKLAAVANEGLTVACSNKLRFEFLSPPAPERIYLARIRVDQEFTPDAAPFLCITNLREVTASGGQVMLPGVTNAGPLTDYGTCEISSRFLDVTPEGCSFALASLTESNLVFATRVQAGTRVRDEIEVATQVSGGEWSPMAFFEFSAAPDSEAFETGWQPVEWTVDRSWLPSGNAHFFRLKRTWLAH